MWYALIMAMLVVAISVIAYIMGYAKGRMDEYDKHELEDRRRRMGLTILK
jgi:hypothetical protein